MKFRGKITDIGCIQHFTRVVGTLAKLAKTITLRITVNKLYFILSERLVNGGVGIWCEMLQANIFNEYNMEGVSVTDANEIYLETVPENFFRCLRSAQNAKSVKIKLTKKQTPCLTFEVELPSLTGHSRVVTHDVPVGVVPRRLWSDLAEPEMPDFDASIYMPALRVLRNIVDRMKNLSNFVRVSANNAGEMKFCVETDLVTVSTYFHDLDRPMWQNDDGISQLTDVKAFFDARIDIRKLAQFLSCQQFSPSKVICNIASDHMVHLLVLHDDVSLQYFMPAVSS